MRDVMPEKQWGDYGDGHVCGLRCGYAWAMMYLREHSDYAERLHASMIDIISKKK